MKAVISRYFTGGLSALLFTYSLPSMALSIANCKVQLHRNGTWIDVIQTPNLKPYQSFKVPTCTFKDIDNSIYLGTAVLRGGFFVTLQLADGRQILNFSAGIRDKEQINFEASGWTPNGDELNVTCTANVDFKDSTAVPTCD